MDVGLVAHIEENLVGRRVEDRVEGQSEFDDTEIGAEMTTRFRQGLDQEGANLLSQLPHLRKTHALEVSRRVNRLQQCSHVSLLPIKRRAVQQKSPLTRGQANHLCQPIVYQRGGWGR